MSYASDFAFEIYAYVDPDTGEATSLFSSSPIGLAIRENGEWVAPESQVQVDGLTDDRDCYQLNWDKNMENIPDDVPDDYEEEHEAVYEFDKGLLNLSNIETYFDLAYKAGESGI
jgi:hypothetical protein